MENKGEMKTRLFRSIIFLFLILGITVPGLAGEPTEKIKRTTDKILSILSDPVFKNPAKTKERRKLIRRAVDERFNWEEMARRSLAAHWAQRTNEEKKEFTYFYSDLLERTYMSKLEEYSGEEVRYDREMIKGNYAIVKVKIVTKKNKDISVQYRLRKEENDWLVYDVLIEGVSLVNNYRVQFNSIILQSSYDNLVKKIREKVAME